ncbi:MAG: hypothetical protein QM764_17640 [Chitinophagaceae bacterium]
MIDSASSICAARNAARISLGRYDEPMSTHVYLSTWPRKNCERLVPFSRMISARSTKRAIVDEQRAAFAGDDVLGLVEAQRAERAERAERLAFVRREDALRGVFDDDETVLRCDRVDRVHFARDARVVHDTDRARARRDRSFDEMSRRD